jgi:hypothetical protein
LEPQITQHYPDPEAEEQGGCPPALPLAPLLLRGCRQLSFSLSLSQFLAMYPPDKEQQHGVTDYPHQ